MDRRQQKTRAAIFSAFERLLSQKKYSKITIKDIIDEANVGRTTFYEHFETKDALLSEMCSNLFHHIFSTDSDKGGHHNFPLSHGDSRTVVTHILYHLQEGSQSMLQLMSGESSETFLFYFRSYLDEMVLPFLTSGLEHKNKAVPESFLQNHISGSFLNMVQWWVHGGMKERPEDLANYFLSVIEPIL